MQAKDHWAEIRPVNYMNRVKKMSSEFAVNRKTYTSGVTCFDIDSFSSDQHMSEN